jgi:diphthamide biosynthesis protein 3
MGLGSDDEHDTEGFYDEIEIEDMEFDEDDQTFYYPCPCGDRFQLTMAEIEQGEEVARCPSCTLRIRVIYDEVGNPFIDGHARHLSNYFFFNFRPFLKKSND